MNRLHGAGYLNQSPDVAAYAEKARAQQEYAAQECEARPVLMPLILNTISDQGSRIHDAVGIVEDFLDRFYGPVPQPCDKGTAATPHPNGIAPELERLLSRNDQAISRLHAAVRRLSEIG